MRRQKILLQEERQKDHIYHVVINNNKKSSKPSTIAHYKVKLHLKISFKPYTVEQPRGLYRLWDHNFSCFMDNCKGIVHHICQDMPERKENITPDLLIC